MPTVAEAKPWNKWLTFLEVEREDQESQQEELEHLQVQFILLMLDNQKTPPAGEEFFLSALI